MLLFTVFFFKDVGFDNLYYAVLGVAMSSRGFTLVELAVVMTIIGLLIGGILRGQQLISNAKAVASVAEMQAIHTAMINFKETYGYQPGDFTRALTSLSGCNAFSFCMNGDGNGFVGDPTLPAYNNGQQLITWENTQFFKHLAMADLIIGVGTGASNIQWGVSHPKSSLSGGYSVTYGVSPDMSVSPAGLVLRIHMSLNEDNIESIGFIRAGPASPSEAGYIDAKIDDGRPSSGLIRASAYGSPPDPFVIACENSYTSSNQKGCVVYMKLK